MALLINETCTGCDACEPVCPNDAIAVGDPIYVIDAFNDNKPFDTFTIEQLAGDLLPGSTIPQRVATGFNRLNLTTHEGGAQPREYLAKYAADRVRATSTVWMASTMGCTESSTTGPNSCGSVFQYAHSSSANR